MRTQLLDLDHPESPPIVCALDFLGRRTAPARFPIPRFMYLLLLTLMFLNFSHRRLHSTSLYSTSFCPISF